MSELSLYGLIGSFFFVMGMVIMIFFRETVIPIELKKPFRMKGYIVCFKVHVTDLAYLAFAVAIVLGGLNFVYDIIQTH